MNTEKLQKNLSADALFNLTKTEFLNITDPLPLRTRKREISFSDITMSAFALFSIKESSLLSFDTRNKYSDNNLNEIYNIENIPSDTYMRERLDLLEPDNLRPVYKNIHRYFRRHQGFKQFEYMNGYYVLALDGTGYFSSTSIHCSNCLEKINKKSGVITYSHQMLGAALVHPDLKVVIPFAPEPIIKQDGMTKNDCERNAAKRFLNKFRKDYPKMKVIIVEDALSSNAPHINELIRYDMKFVLGVKPGDHTFLFNYLEENKSKITEKSGSKGNISYNYKYYNNVPINASNSDLLVNYIEYTETKNNKTTHFSWITNFIVTDVNVLQLVRAGRARWKIENETFNTLKNQGYNFEHNFGHGKKNLSSVFASLMMLAFLVDQIQQSSYELFQVAWMDRKSKKALWENMRSLFLSLEFISMEEIFQAIVYGYKINSFTVLTETQ